MFWKFYELNINLTYSKKKDNLESILLIMYTKYTL